jgi:hypothetical protein
VARLDPRHAQDGQWERLQRGLLSAIGVGLERAPAEVSARLPAGTAPVLVSYAQHPTQNQEVALKVVAQLARASADAVAQLVRAGAPLALLRTLAFEYDNASLRRLSGLALAPMLAQDRALADAVARCLDSGVAAALALGDADKAVSALDHDHLTPRSIWDASTRERFREALDDALRALGADSPWDPAAWVVRYPQLDSELRVAGVYVHMYNNDPAWPLDRPKEFLEGLLAGLRGYGEGYEGVRRDGDLPGVLALAVALYNLLRGKPELADSLDHDWLLFALQDQRGFMAKNAAGAFFPFQRCLLLALDAALASPLFRLKVDRAGLEAAIKAFLKDVSDSGVREIGERILSGGGGGGGGGGLSAAATHFTFGGLEYVPKSSHASREVRSVMVKGRPSVAGPPSVGVRDLELPGEDWVEHARPARVAPLPPKKPLPLRPLPLPPKKEAEKEVELELPPPPPPLTLPPMPAPELGILAEIRGFKRREGVVVEVKKKVEREVKEEEGLAAIMERSMLSRRMTIAAADEEEEEEEGDCDDWL